MFFICILLVALVGLQPFQLQLEISGVFCLLQVDVHFPPTSNDSLRKFCQFDPRLSIELNEVSANVRVALVATSLDAVIAAFLDEV